MIRIEPPIPLPVDFVYISIGEMNAIEPSPSRATGRLRGVLNILLVAGAGVATITAVAAIIGLSWWAVSLPPAVPVAAPTSQSHPNALAPAAPPAVARSMLLPTSPPRGAAPAAAAPATAEPPAAVASTAAAVLPPAVAPPAANFDPDGKKNRAIGHGLERLGQNPELQRQVGVPEADEEDK